MGRPDTVTQVSPHDDTRLRQPVSIRYSSLGLFDRESSLIIVYSYRGVSRSQSSPDCPCPT